jgi:hypothetical protein
MAVVPFNQTRIVPQRGYLLRTAGGTLVPAEVDTPRSNGQALDAFNSLRPYMSSPVDRLGKLVDPRFLTLDHMQLMMYDELIMFLMQYQTSQLVNAQYEITGSDPEQTAFIKAWYDSVHLNFMLSAAPAVHFGWQGLIKRFAFDTPNWKDGEQTWKSTVEPYVVREFTQIDQQFGQPLYDEQGHFAGISVDGHPNVPTIHALWITIGAHWVAGDPMGWGTFRAAYVPWWKKHFGDDQETLYMQRGVDPAVVVRHPSGMPKDGPLTYSQIALGIGNSVRGGMTVAMPSDTYPIVDDGGYTQKPSGSRKWDIEYLINTGDVSNFMNLEDRQDKRICRAFLTPDQAILESKSMGLGGPNTAEVLGNIAEDCQMQNAAQIDDHFNKYVFPIILRANYGSKAKPVQKRTMRLSDRAKVHLKDAFTALLARADVKPTFIDGPRIAEQLGVPTIDVPQEVSGPAQPNPAPSVAQDNQSGKGVQAPASGQKATPQGNPTTPPNTPATASITRFAQELDRLDDDPFGPDEDVNDEEAETIFAATLQDLDRDAEEEPQGDAETFGTLPKKFKFERSMQALMDATDTEIAALLRGFKNGHAPGDTINRIYTTLRNAGLRAAQLGKIERGESSSLTAAERAEVQKWASFQKTHLRKVYTVMRTTLDKNPDATVRAAEINTLVNYLENVRFPMYVNALRAEFERARARFTISKYPRSGDTRCLVNCYCTLRWEFDDDANAWRVWWDLGDEPERHCSDCPELAANSPYYAGEL